MERLGTIPLVGLSCLLFGVALLLSWTEGARHLDLQALAMGLALLAFLVAAVAARRLRPRGDS